MACKFNYGVVILYLYVSSFLLALFVLMPIMIALFATTWSPSFSINLFGNQEALNITTSDNTSVSTPINMTIHFDLKIKNTNKAIGLHYPDPIKLTFSYFPNVSMNVNLAEYELDSFYQGNRKTRHVKDMVQTKGFPTVLEGTDLIAIRVDLVGSYRYKKAGTKRHKVELGCVVGINYTTSKKLKIGFIKLVQPGLDSELKEKDPSADYTNGFDSDSNDISSNGYH